MQENPVLKVAAKAVIINSSGKMLIVREAMTDKNAKAGQWGLVGGQLESGEAFLDGLEREVMEETGLRVQVGRPLYVGEWCPVIHGARRQIIGMFMLCTTSSDQVTLSSEHDAYQWIEPSKRREFAMMEPDCFAVDTLKEMREKYGERYGN